MKEIEKIRKKLDLIDSKLIEFFAKRFELVKKIGEIKKEKDMPVLDSKRWQEVLDSRKAKGLEFNLEQSFVEDIWERIHKQSLEIEEN